MAGSSPPPVVNALTASQRVLAAFWDLASLEEGSRVAATETLLSDVLEDQASNAPKASGAAEQLPQAQAGGGDGGRNAPRLELALSKCSPLMTYCLRRLARGLGSGRDASRQGFATALATVLSYTSGAPGPLPEGVLPVDASAAPLLGHAEGLVLLDRSIEAAGASAKGGDMRDYVLGRLFGLASLVRGGLVRDVSSAAAIIPPLLALASKKGWLREAVVAVLLELLLGGPAGGSTSAGAGAGAGASADGAAEGAPGKSQGKSKGKGKGGAEAWAEGGAAGKPQAVRWLRDEDVRTLLSSGPGGCQALRAFLNVTPQEASPEALLLALCLWPLLPPDLLATGPLPHAASQPPPLGFPLHPSPPATAASPAVARAAAALFDPAYLAKVLPALQDTTAASPRLHSLWPHLLAFLLPGFTPQHAKHKQAGVPEAGTAPPAASLPPPNAAHVEALWSVVVDQGLLTSSHERKFLACQLFQMLLPRLPASVVPVVLSRNFTSLLSTNLAKPDSYLHSMAKRVMERISNFMERSPDGAAKLSMSTALQRLGNSGALQQAKVKAASRLGEGLDSEAIQQYMQQYMDQFLHPASAQQQTGEQGQGGNAANGSGNSKAGRKSFGKRKEEEEEEEEEHEEEEQAGAAQELALSRQRALAADQLSAVLRMPAATEAQRLAVLTFLATHSFFAATPAAAAASMGAHAAGAGSGKAGKKGKGGKGEAGAAAVALSPELKQAAQALAGGAPPLSPATHLYCRQRLLQHITSVPGGTSGSAGGKEAPVGTKRKAESNGEEGAEEEGAGPRKKGPGQAEPPGTPGHGASHTWSDPSRFLGPVAAYVRELHSTLSTHSAQSGVQLAVEGLGEEGEAALAVLRELQDALEPLAARSEAAGSHGSSKAQGQAQGHTGARARALSSLVALLQLHVLSHPPSAPEASVLMDLRRVAQQAVGAQLSDLEMQAVKDGEDDGEEEEEEEGEEEGPKGQKGPAWPEVLVDVLLSLLARPSAPLPSVPLRNVCEGVWRSMCEDLTLVGLQDLLRVVVADLGRKGGGPGESVLGDEGDEEDEVEEEVGGSDASDDDDDQSDEKDEEEEEEEVDEAKAAALKAALKASGAAPDSDEEEEEDEGLDDAAMFRMEPKIAAYLRAAADARRGARDATEALAALKFRAVAMLEVFARKAPSSPLLLVAAPPLLKALHLAVRPQGPRGTGGNKLLAQRLRAVLGKTVCKAKPTYSADLLPLGSPGGPGEDEAGPSAEKGRAPAAGAAAEAGGSTLPAVLRRVRHLAARAEDKEVAADAARVLALMLRACSAPDTPEPVRDLATDSMVWAVGDWATKRTTRLSLPTMKELIARAGPAATSPPVLLALLRKAAGEARNAYTQAQALDLCALALQHLASSASASGKGPKGGEGKGAAAAVKGDRGVPEGKGAGAKEGSGRLLSLLRPLAPGLGPAVAAAAQGGSGMKAEHHAEALRAAVRMAELCRHAVSEGGPGRKLAELLAPEWLNAVVKAVATVRDLGCPPRVDTQLSRLVQSLGLTERLATAQPDPALKAKLLKQRAGAAGAAAAGGAVAAARKGTAAAKAGEGGAAAKQGGNAGPAGSKVKAGQASGNAKPVGAGAKSGAGKPANLAGAATKSAAGLAPSRGGPAAASGAKPGAGAGAAGKGGEGASGPGRAGGPGKRPAGEQEQLQSPAKKHAPEQPASKTSTGKRPGPQPGAGAAGSAGAGKEGGKAGKRAKVSGS